jgi:DNA-directed RNA polymerase subunit RPC12/RpoP
MLQYKCTKCGIEKEENEYYHNWVWRKKKTIKVLYRNTVCIECVKKHTQENVKANPEKRKEQIKRDNARPKKILSHRANGKRQREEGYQIEYRRKNKEKVRAYCKNHRDHDITKSEEESMLKVFDYSCAYCGTTLKEHKE